MPHSLNIGKPGGATKKGGGVMALPASPLTRPLSFDKDFLIIGHLMNMNLSKPGPKPSKKPAVQMIEISIKLLFMIKRSQYIFKVCHRN